MTAEIPRPPQNKVTDALKTTGRNVVDWSRRVWHKLYIQDSIKAQKIIDESFLRVMIDRFSTHEGRESQGRRRLGQEFDAARTKISEIQAQNKGLSPEEAKAATDRIMSDDRPDVLDPIAMQRLR